MKENTFKNGVKKRLFSIVLALVMLFTLIPMSSMIVYAANFTNTEVSNPTFYSSGCLKTLDVTIQAYGDDYATAYGKIGVHTSESSYNYGHRYITSSNCTTWPDKIDDPTLVGISTMEFLWTDCNKHTVTVQFEDNEVPCNQEKTYVVHLWTRATSFGIYTDYRFADLKTTADGKLSFGGKEIVINKGTITNGSPESDSAKNHGYITVDETAAEGETVTVTVNPAEGYQLKSLTATPVAPTISTIADVLATVAGAFPTSNEKAWKSGELNSCYKSGDNLHLKAFKPTFDIPLTTAVSGSGEGFTCSYNSVTFTFNMTEGKLTSIKVEGADFGLDGTYAPASTPSAEPETITPEKQTDGTYQFKMPGYAVTVTAEFEEVPASTYAITNGTPESDSAKNHGYITIDKANAEEGETVTVKVNPADGYQLKSLSGTGMQFVTVDPNGTTAPNVNAAGFGGSTVRNGNFFGHNFDYYINDKKEVVIKTEADPISRPHAVIGVANPYSLDVTGTAYDAETLKQLAWLITDGINDAGLVCSINGVSTADIKSNPYSHTNDGAPEIMVVHLVREILNVCGTVGEAKTFIEAHDITPLSADWDAHIMIADATNTVIVEFTGEGVKFVEQDQWIMTDFYNHLFNEEGFLTDHKPANFPDHSIGMERYWVLSDNYNLSNSILGTVDLLKKVSYTKTYDKNVDPFWCSEFYRTDMIPTFGNYPMEYWTKQKILAEDAPKNLIEKYAAYEADGTYDTADGLKHTAHSSVYSIKDKTLTVSFGDNQKYIFTFDGLTNPEITPAKQTDGTYQFEMPGYAVTVTAEFEKIHVHAPDLVNGQPATETAAGFKDYYECDCGALFEDENGTTPIENLDVWKAVGGNGYLPKLKHTHAPVLVKGKSATKDGAGFKSYYKCECGKYFEDVTCKVEITNLAKWKAKGGNGYLPKLKHTHAPVLVKGKSATKDGAGFKSYYKCECGKYFEDATCKVEITNLAKWKAKGGNGYIAKLDHTHAPVLVKGQAATKDAAGFKSYYKCECGKYFEDATCKVEITNLAKWKANGGNGYIAKPGEEPKSPQTGDTSNTALWFMLTALSSMGYCSCLVLGKKRKKAQ